MRTDQDAHGRAMQDFLTRQRGYEIIERDDGFIGLSGGPAPYFTDYRDWSAHQKRAMRFVKGRVLDIGCGAGRACLYLQGRGHEVTGIDVSPGAIDVCRQRGVRDARVLSITRVSAGLGRFGTILMLGNNFGLFGSFKRARWLLRKLRGITGEGARIIAESLEPYATDEACHLAYHELNRGRGRMAGQLRIRVRYQTYATAWFDYLLVSQDEMKSILDGTGWRLARTLEGNRGIYIAVIEKE